jgi:hypothetical protein
MEENASAQEATPAQLIDARIAELKDWRGVTLANVRALIRQALPDVVEEWKWRGVPVWSHGGILCTGETYKSVVKLTFAKGAALDDPEGAKLNEAAFTALIQAAAALNATKAKPRKT